MRKPGAVKFDFCAELYVGTRGTDHHAYQRCGDWNVTMMSRDSTPSQGYTVTCTAWDPALSQRYTTLYREGQVWDRSDTYTGPRYRNGNKRKRHHPLVTPGRDVHGAWYYIKLRRIGKRLEYYFDNELIFARDDESPMTDGLFGLWTYRNAIVVARAKVADTRELRTPELPPGAFREDGTVQAGEGCVQLLELRPAGGKLMTFEAFANGRRVAPPDRLLPADEG